MSLKGIVKDYLTFNKRERLGAIALVILVLTIYFLPSLFRNGTAASRLVPDSLLLKSKDTTTRNKYQQQDSSSREDESITYLQYDPLKTKTVEEGELFEFDPNTLPIEGWQRLGLRDKTINTLNNYRNKGGKFRRPEDLQKVYGLPPAFYERVKDYIKIPTPAPQQIFSSRQPYPANPTTTQPSSAPTNHTPASPRFEYARKQYHTILINEADTSTLATLPGIGSRLAFRIVNYREKLGGFYSADQVGETYGVPDSTFQKIKPYLKITGDVKKFNVNTAIADELKLHPYIHWKIANGIIYYRDKHKPVKTIDELKDIPQIDAATFEKLKHYLTL